jgi:hypothetical protein
MTTHMYCMFSVNFYDKIATLNIFEVLGYLSVCVCASNIGILFCDGICLFSVTVSVVFIATNRYLREVILRALFCETIGVSRVLTDRHIILLAPEFLHLNYTFITDSMILKLINIIRN